MNHENGIVNLTHSDKDVLMFLLCNRITPFGAMVNPGFNSGKTPKLHKWEKSWDMANKKVASNFGSPGMILTKMYQYDAPLSLTQESTGVFILVVFFWTYGISGTLVS